MRRLNPLLWRPGRSHLNRIAWCAFLCCAFVLGAALLRITLNTGAEAAAPPALVEIPASDTVGAASPADPQVLGSRRREERQLAREVRNDAAEVLEMRRGEFIRGVRAETKAQEAGKRIATPCLDQLKLSLIDHPEAVSLGLYDERTGEIDIERFGEILQMILDFLSQLFAMFGMFMADNDPILPDANAAYLACIAPEAAPAPDQAKPDQAKPDQTKPDQCKAAARQRTPVRKIVKAAAAAPVKATKAKVRRAKGRRVTRTANRCCAADQTKPDQCKAATCQRTPVRKIVKAAAAAPVKATKAKVRRAKCRRVTRTANRCCAA